MFQVGGVKSVPIFFAPLPRTRNLFYCPFMCNHAHKNMPYRQGDHIERIFAFWAVVYFGFEKCQSM
jgi:hypothetical protein